jgi:nucleoid-associated protein YgaU
MSVFKNTLRSSLLLACGLAAVSLSAETPEIISLRSKAVKGNPVAQYTLARVFADPRSPNADKVEAYAWFQIAAENGASGKEIGRLIEVMTPKELEQGKQRLQELRSQIPGMSNPTPSAAVNAAAENISSAAAAREQGDLADTRAAARELALKNQQLEDIAAERGRSLSAAQAEIEKLKEAAKSPAVPESQALIALTAERDLLTRQLADAQVLARKMTDLPERLQRSERDNTLLRQQNTKLNSALKEAEEKLKAKAPEKDNTDAATNELAVVRERFLNEQKRSQELAASAAQLALDNERLRRESAQAAAVGDLSSLRDKLAALEKQNSELVQRATDAETKLAAVPVPVPAPAAVVDTTASTELQKQLDETNEKLSTALRSYTLLQQELDQVRSASSQSTAEAEARLSTAQSEASALRSQLSASGVELQDRNNSLAALQAEITRIRADSITQGQELLALRDQLRQTQAQYGAVAEENAQLKTRLAVVAPSPSSVLATPMRPGSAAAQAAITLPPVLKTPAQETGRQHIITDGDSLSRISRKYYGTPDRWKEIFDANRNILNDPSRLPKGASLKIP